MIKKRMYYVEVLDFGLEHPEWNKHFDFDDFEKAFAYCKELNFHGHEFSLLVVDEYSDEVSD